MTLPQIDALIDVNLTQQSVADRITGSELRAVMHAVSLKLRDVVEYVTNAVPYTIMIPAGYLLETLVIKLISNTTASCETATSPNTDNLIYPETVTAALGAVWNLTQIAWANRDIVVKGLPVGSSNRILNKNRVHVGISTHYIIFEVGNRLHGIAVNRGSQWVGCCRNYPQHTSG